MIMTTITLVEITYKYIATTTTTHPQTRPSSSLSDTMGKKPGHNVNIKTPWMQTYNHKAQELCVEVEVSFLGSPYLTVLKYGLFGRKAT